MHKKLLQTGLAGVVILIYYFMLVHFNLGVPCLFHKITGLLCPGCGITRMILAIMRLDFKSAYQYNQVIFVSSPFIIYLCIRLYISWLISRPYILSLVEKVLVYVFIIVLLIFGIYRNLF